MGDAKRDSNYVPTLLAVSNADGVTPVTLYADPTTHRLLTSASGGTLAGLSDVQLTGTAQGDILYYSGTKWVNLAAGTNGKFLQTQGAGANPQWATATASAAGSDTQVQFNDGGTNLGGDAGFTYNKTTDTATLVGPIQAATANIADTDASHYLVITAGSNLTANRVLTLTTGDSARTVTISGNATISQDYSTSGNPQFATIELGNASDTTISRASAGIIAVEGVNQVNVSASQTLTNKTLTAPVINAGTIGTSLVPTSDDGAALGDTTHNFSDLFLATGAVLNYANGNVVVTHSSGILTMGTGEMRITTPGTNAASVVTVGGTQTLTNKTFGNTTTLTIKDTLFTIQDDGDATKLIAFQASGITTGNTRTITMPDSNTTLPIISQIVTISGPTAARTYTFPDAAATIARTDAGQTFTGTQVMTSPKILTSILDTNGNESIDMIATASAVNEVEITNAATGTTGPLIKAAGETNIDLRLSGKGTGAVHIITGSYGDITADSDGATITFDLAVTNIHTVTLGGNRTLALSNAHVGQCFMLRLLQDGTGSRTVTWFTTLKWAGSSAPTLTTTASKADTFGFLVTSSGNYDGFVIGQNIG